jgi:hypothetical protein
VKRPALQKYGLMALNAALAGHESSWDEAAVSARAAALLEKALEIWPRAGGP